MEPCSTCSNESAFAMISPCAWVALWWSPDWRISICMTDWRLCLDKGRPGPSCLSLAAQLLSGTTTIQAGTPSQQRLQDRWPNNSVPGHNKLSDTLACSLPKRSSAICNLAAVLWAICCAACCCCCTCGTSARALSLCSLASGCLLALARCCWSLQSKDAAVAGQFVAV